MGLQLVTGPPSEPISLEEAKHHVGVPDSITDHDAKLTNLIIAARQKVERDCGKKLITQTWDVTFDAFPECRGPIVLPIGPLQSVVSVTGYDDADTPTVVNAATYVVDAISTRPRIALRKSQSWPSTVLRPVNGLIVRGIFGHGQVAAVNAAVAPVRPAMLFLIGHWFDSVEDVPRAYWATLSSCETVSLV